MGLTEVLAADGKPYDIDNIKELALGEVEVIQYLRPDGKRRRMAVPLGEDYVEKAKDLILSAEELRTGEIALYARRKSRSTEHEFIELAENGPRPESPDKKLRLLINRMRKEA